MSEEIKNNLIDDKDLNVNGGVGIVLKPIKETLATLSADVKEKLSKANTDVEVCKILSDNGIDVEKIEKEIKRLVPNFNKDYLALNDGDLAKISGGFKNKFSETDVHCTCGASNRKQFSYQFFASNFHDDDEVFDIYRCKECGNKILITNGRYFVGADVITG